jgi:BioD-like phosphotransacetylase family protein
MRSVVIAGVDKESGKTVVALGLALNAKGHVEYVKPIRDHLKKVEDRLFERDAELAQRVLQSKEPFEDISHYDFDPARRADTKPLLKELRVRAKRSDLLLVEAGEYAETGHCQGISAFDIAKELGAPLVLVTGPDTAMLDRVLMLIEYAYHEGVDVLGVVNNDHDGRLAKLLKARKVPVLGSIPFEPRLRYFRVREILDEVGGECVAGSKGLDRVVESIVIGAMTAETALPLMRRIPRKCVITGGDRSDLQLAALSTDTSVLVLTGGLRPSSMVMSEAHEQGVPLIVVSADTYTVTERFDRLQARINPEDKGMVGLVRQLVRKNVDLKRVFGK